ncbi:MAG: hypothetical protein JO055_04485, partial [Alphaproteobacteria bacterium]|nr:hypothetical protein [Alphaproteobacteria bacterium]
MPTRRDLLLGALLAAPAYLLLATARRVHALPDPAVRRWLDRQQDLALALSRGEVRPAQWQSEIEALARSMDVPQLMAEIARSDVRIAKGGTPNDPIKHTVAFRDEAGARRRLRFGAALFTFHRGDVITPHAHRHMVSAHLVVEGAFRVRNFDRLRDEASAIVVRPSGDRVIEVGAISTMSAERDNVHWFVPRTERAITFDVVISDLDAGAPSHVIEAIDPMRG